MRSFSGASLGHFQGVQRHSPEHFEKFPMKHSCKDRNRDSQGSLSQLLKTMVTQAGGGGRQGRGGCMILSVYVEGEETSRCARRS